MAHFATHGRGFEDPILVMSSCLLLSQEKSDTSGSGDGVVKAYEVHSGLSLDADLVVLSACATSKTGVLGLALGLQAAGARAVHERGVSGPP